jgi:transcriptional regulator with XRE-family HTH domain
MLCRSKGAIGPDGAGSEGIAVTQADERTGGIGAALRRARLSRGLTLEASARLVEVTKGYLSKVENNQATPSMGVMVRLADAFGIPLSDLLMPDGQRQPISVVRANERIPTRRGNDSGYQFELASTGKLDPRGEVFFLTLPVPNGEEPSFFKHSGEEVFLVLEGRVRFSYAGSEFILKKGDCVQFDSNVEHFAISDGDQPAQLFIVTIPERADRA